MPKKKFKKTLHFQKSITYLFFCILMAILLSFLVGLLYGLDTDKSSIFYLLVMIDMGFLIAICYYVSQLNANNPSSELAATTLARYTLYNDTNDNHGLFSHDGFFHEVRNILSKDVPLACLAVLHIEAMEFLERMIGQRKMNSVIEEISSTLQNISSIQCISGFKSNNEYWIFLYDSNQTNILRCLDLTISNLEEIMKDGCDMPNSSYVKCGYSWYPQQAVSTASLANNADFALYEAILAKKKKRHEFSNESYQKQEAEYKRNALFDRILEKGDLTYYFQPIIKANDGSIYGYEALMRTKDPDAMSPIEILDIAQKQNRLYEIEKATFFNVLHIISQNSYLLKDKKIFINSIPNHQLKSEDFETLYSAYANYMNQIVIEITESSDQTQESMDTLHKYIHLMGAELALDDYGTGYSNEANLIKNNPHYLKIDRALISNIHQDIKKQLLVSNIIKFTKQYNMLSLAEGVETYDELQTVICLGIDLIQGFYTARPSADLVDCLPIFLKDKILNINSNQNEYYSS